ncbi:M28 family peptidase [Archangium sp.]|uniref:M28 family peptidase n=1 Tax=Archangium sp. TaxID=1872627 RepID=UPI002D380A45|nr:M28 family peptidase [Archangium sp.]HYO59972.1 M28 family peptidase [Archangium sp.]
MNPRQSPALLLCLALLGTTACSEKPLLEGARMERLREIAERVEQDRLMGLVQELVQAHRQDTPVDCSSFQDLPDEALEALCNLTRERAGALMQSRLESLGLRVQRHESSSGPFATSNIIAELPGTTRPWEIVLVGAHYDAFHAGADDNSTGVAAVLELARILSQYRFERTIRFVGFDLEELGLVGSSRYVEERLGPDEIVASVVFDCIGYYDSAPGTQRSIPGLPAPSSGDFLAVIGNDVSRGRASELYALNEALQLTKVIPILAPADGASPVGGNLMRSDHTPFWLTGHDALFLTDTANFRNSNYHQRTDTLETLDAVSFRRTVQVSAATLAFWAGGPQ